MDAKTKRNFLMVLSCHWPQCIPSDQALKSRNCSIFATGLGVLGLLGWRRKRKAQAAA
jgi:hypothetical protein